MVTTAVMLTPDERIDLMAVALAGLSVGDAFGERFFVEPTVAERLIADRSVPAAPWSYTDDTEMALSRTVSGLGDRDTTCAIVGGIVACYVGAAGIPTAWLQAREPLPYRTTPGAPE